MSTWIQQKRSHVVGNKNALIPAPFLISEAEHLCSTKETLLKGRFIGFSEVPHYWNILTRHWKKIGNNGLKINIQNIGLTGYCLKLLTRPLRERKI